MSSLFTIKIELNTGEKFEINYFSIDEFLEDNGLKSMLDGDLVTRCGVYRKDKRITAIPIMSWDRLKDAVVSNSTLILKGK